MVSSDDWRLTDQEEYLRGKTLYWRQYKAHSDSWDHDHCEFCWDKFMEVNYPDTLQEGYTTEDEYYWVCKKCLEDFQKMFEWKVGS